MKKIISTLNRKIEQIKMMMKAKIILKCHQKKMILVIFNFRDKEYLLNRIQHKKASDFYKKTWLEIKNKDIKCLLALFLMNFCKHLLLQKMIVHFIWILMEIMIQTSDSFNGVVKLIKFKFHVLILQDFFKTVKLR